MNTNTANALGSDWRPTSMAIAALIAMTLWLYRDTGGSLVTLWSQSETFAHGFLVPFISAWLLWRKRKALGAVAPTLSPAPLTLLAVVVVAAVWLAGDLADVNPVAQFALVALIVLAFPALAGWKATRVVLFPLTFLFFAVPFGEFLLPWLMARTADFTVLALRASGIPVYRDGLQFVIPSGTWSVVEACSGVRYLIASLMVGALFSYLNYRSARRRTLFMLVALAIPIVANWVRAYMIVMIGHLSSNKLAVGVDHLIYGWFFFGLVIGVMFLVGARWSEASVESVPVVDLSGNPNPQGGSPRLWLTFAATLALLAMPSMALRVLDAGQDRGAPQLVEPGIAAGAVVDSTVLPVWTPAFENPSTAFERRYQFRDQPVGLYVGYYRGQGPGRKLASSNNRLVRSNDQHWVVAESSVRHVEADGRAIAVRSARLRRPVTSSDATIMAVRQIYWVNGRLEASDVRAKLWGGWYRLLGRGDDGAAIIVYAQEQRPGEADAALDAFLSEHLAAVDLQLRKARDGD